MTKKNKRAGVETTPAESSYPELITIVIDKVLYDLLKEGKINQVLTWKEIKDKPDQIGISSTHGDDTIVLKVKRIDTVLFGYLPNGYPPQFAAKQKTTRVHIEPVQAEDDGGIQPAEESVTEGE